MFNIVGMLCGAFMIGTVAGGWLTYKIVASDHLGELVVKLQRRNATLERDIMQAEVDRNALDVARRRLEASKSSGCVFTDDDMARLKAL